MYTPGPLCDCLRGRKEQGMIRSADIREWREHEVVTREATAAASPAPPTQPVETAKAIPDPVSNGATGTV